MVLQEQENNYNYQLVTAFQKKMNKEDRTLMIHLNASDERGIDIIRNQILQFELKELMMV